MKFVACLSALVVTSMLAVSSAHADTTCNSFKTAYPNLPVPFCEDFDTYCTNPPAWPDACSGSSGATATPMRQLWSRSSFNHNTRQYCGSEFAIETGTTILPSPPYGGRFPNGGDEGGLLGQQTVDLISCEGIYARKGNPDPNHHKCVPLADVYGANVTAITGTDANPLTLTFSMSGGIQAANKLPNSTGYMELALDNDPPPVEGQFTPRRKNHAPMDFIWVGEPEVGTNGCESCYGFCGNNNNGTHVPWRTICQQEFRRATNPDTCPPLDTEIRPVLAVGAVAELDNNPCHCENVAGLQQPTNDHLSYFDGQKWRILRQGMGGPGSSGDFILADKITFVTLVIKSTTVDIYMFNNKHGFNDSALGLPRFYTGGFNKLRGGAATGCELNSGAHSCKDGIAGDKCIKQGGNRCDTGGYQIQNSGYVAFDNVILHSGEGVTQTGSCCHANGTCTDGVLPENCTAPGDIHGGPNSHCSTTSCCPHGSYTWADSDVDGDVDAEDFGRFQLCITGSNPSGGVPAECACFDRVTTVPGIDVDDFNAFKNCVTGATIPWAPTPQCPAN